MRYPLAIFSALCIVICNLSCSQHDSNIDVLTPTLTESFQKSATAILKQNMTLVADLENKTADPATAYKAAIWFPKATLLHSYTLILFKYVDSVIKGGEQTSGRVNKLNEDLVDTLLHYEQKMFAVDSQFTPTFTKSISFFPSSLMTDNSTRQRTITFLNSLDENKRMMILKQFQNNIAVAANVMIWYCNQKVGMIDGPGFYSSYAALIWQKTNHLKAGESLEINAGLGMLAARQLQQITIAGKPVQLDAQGVATLALIAPRKPGTYRVPVIINYTDHDGNKQTISQEIKYTVDP